MSSEVSKAFGLEYDTLTFLIRRDEKKVESVKWIPGVMCMLNLDFVW